MRLTTIVQQVETVQQGTFIVGALSVSYFISNPAPTQWVAVGVVSSASMLVGVGPSEALAIAALAARCRQLQEDLLETAKEYATEWAYSSLS